MKNKEQMEGMIRDKTQVALRSFRLGIAWDAAKIAIFGCMIAALVATPTENWFLNAAIWFILGLLCARAVANIIHSHAKIKELRQISVAFEDFVNQINSQIEEESEEGGKEK